MSETVADGVEPVRYMAFVTQVWIREGSEWRLLHNHESTLDLGKQTQDIGADESADNGG